MKLTIIREKWLRGEGPSFSRLLRPADGKQCCVGFYLEACGVSPSELSDIGAPTDSRLISRIPVVTKWLVEEPHWNSPDAGALYLVNDSPSVPDSVREARVVEVFLRHGVEVEFV